MSKPKAALKTGTKAVSRIVKAAREIHGTFMEGRRPSMNFPSAASPPSPPSSNNAEKFLP